MKAARIATVLILVYLAVRWLQAGTDFALPTILPFLGGHEPSLWYDVVGGLGMLAIAAWGLGRLGRHRKDDE